MFKIIDAHTHAYLVPYQGFQEMASGGVKRAINCSLVIGARYAESYFDYFEGTFDFYKRIAASAGLELALAVGVHPMGIPQDWQRVVKRLPEYLQRENVVGIGEVGMNSASQLEQDVLLAQLEIARETGVPVIIHTPRDNRPEVVARTLDIADRAGVDPGRLVIDHANTDIIEQINSFGAVPGLTVRLQGFTMEYLADNIEQFKHGILNSDYSNIIKNDPAIVPKAVEYMQGRGIDEQVIKNMCCDRAAQLFGLGTD